MKNKEINKVAMFKDFTKQSLKNDGGEFYETLMDEIIKPMLDQGCIFNGYNCIMRAEDEIGLHTLVFTEPDDKHAEIPTYSDEGTSSYSYTWYGTVYIHIPMPF